jgi:hypothetical protein
MTVAIRPLTTSQQARGTETAIWEVCACRGRRSVPRTSASIRCNLLAGYGPHRDSLRRASQCECFTAPQAIRQGRRSWRPNSTRPSRWTRWSRGIGCPPSGRGLLWSYDLSVLGALIFAHVAGREHKDRLAGFDILESASASDGRTSPHPSRPRSLSGSVRKPSSRGLRCPVAGIARCPHLLGQSGLYSLSERLSRPAHLRHGRTDTRLRVAIPVTWPLAEVRG